MRRAEFETLALSQLDAVYRLALRLTRNPEAASDLVQDTFVRAIRPETVARFDPQGARPEGPAEESMRAWLFTICHNLFYSQVKRAGRAPTLVGEFFTDAADGPPPSEPPPAWNRASLDWDHVDGRLKAAIEGLREEFREVLLMWGVDGLKYREIGEILGVPIGTVMSRLHRARKLVADVLASDPGASDDLGLEVRRRASDPGVASENGS